MEPISPVSSSSVSFQTTQSLWRLYLYSLALSGLMEAVHKSWEIFGQEIARQGQKGRIAHIAHLRLKRLIEASALFSSRSKRQI